MKYLVWGTGSAAENYLHGRYNGYFYPTRNDIVAFVDNDNNKSGKFFLGKKIILPSQICNYEFERILICSSYVKEIKLQLINELNIKSDCIFTREDMDEIIYEYFDKTYDLSNKRVLVIVMTSEEYSYKEYYKTNHYFVHTPDVINIDSVTNIDFIYNIKNKYDYFIFSERLVYKEYDILDIKDFIMSKYDLIKKLSKKLQVSPEKILDSPINDILQSKDKALSWGNENPDKIFYVIRPWSGEGLVRNVQSVIKETYYARSKGYIPVVDMYTYATRYHEENEVGNINAWEKFFEQPDRYNMKDVLNSKNIIISGLSHHLLSKFEFNGIIMKPGLKEDLYEFCTFFDKKVLGVCYRGTDYNLDIGLFHPIQPTVNTAIKTVKKKIEEWGGLRNSMQSF